MDDDEKQPKRKRPASLAGKLGSIPHPAQGQKPRPPTVERPQTAAPGTSGAVKPRPATPNKPARAAVPQRPATTRLATPPTPSAPPGGIARQLGSLKRGPRRGR